MFNDSDQKTVAAAILRGQESAGVLKARIDPTLSVHVDTILDSFSTFLSLLASSSHQLNKKRKSFGEEELVFDSPTLIIDDGFSWRKYGQKFIKNSPHQRSYYRCSGHNCKVKKHVQKIQDSPPIFRTTYIGFGSHTCQTQAFLHSAQDSESSTMIQFDQASNEHQETDQLVDQAEHGNDQDFFMNDDDFWVSDDLEMMLSYNDYDVDSFRL